MADDPEAGQEKAKIPSGSCQFGVRRALVERLFF